MIPIDLDRTSLDDALLCARACELSYLDFYKREFIEGVTALGFLRHSVIDKAGVQAFCASNDSTLLICFRGTDSTSDWLADAMSAKVALQGLDGKVHTGFLRTLLVVCDDVFDILRNLMLDGGGLRILVCGHSLGGAMATLFASRCKYFIHLVCTFGSPRVGDAEFAERFNKRFKSHSLRFVNNNDAVARVPWKCMGYDHVWHQHYFDAAGRLHPFYQPGRLRKLWHALQGRAYALLSVKLGDGARDHSMIDYCALLLAEQGRRHG